MQYSLIFKLESGGDHKVSAAFGENILSAAIRAEMLESESVPEPFSEESGGTGWTDWW